MIVVECVDLGANLDAFVADGGFRVHVITPADDPRRIVLDGHGVRVVLVRSERDVPVHLEIEGPMDEPSEGGWTLRTPNGSTLTLRSTSGSNGPIAELDLPESQPTLSVVGAADGGFGVGRAGMEYRDLLPDRWGGRFIASHIAITDGGDVADWVHFHRIRFQMIFVAAGWVDVVYEDQGSPFRMEAGDCVVQPPEIRHRVLRSSAGLEVIEVGCPAEHDTIADHDLALPTALLRPDRDFGGQRFVRHVARDASTTAWIVSGLRARETGVGSATDGLAGAVVVSGDAASPASSGWMRHDEEFVLCVGVRGAATLEVHGHGPVPLPERASVALPPGTVWRWVDVDRGHEALVVSMSADAIVGTDAPV